MTDGGEIMKYGSGFSVLLENKLLMKSLLQRVDVLNWRWAAKTNTERSGTERAEEMPIYHFTERRPTKLGSLRQRKVLLD